MGGPTYVVKMATFELRGNRNLNQEKGERAGPHQYQRHSSRHRRPVTQNEIYQDAIKILDKLLTQNIEERQRSASKTVRQREAKTRILETFGHGQVGGYAAGDHAFSKRAQTVPESVYKPDRRRSEDRQMIILNHPGDKIQTESLEDVVSSADTEASEHEDDSPRKKKSFFKRAKERLRHTFRRDQRQKEEDYGPQEKSDPKSKRQKPRGKPQKEDKKSQDNRNSPKKTSPAQSVESGVVKNGMNSSLPSTTESNTSGQTRRKSFLKSVRHSFSRSKKDVLPGSKSEEPMSQKASTLPGRSASISDNPHLPPGPPAPPSAPPEVQASAVPRRPPSQSASRSSDARLSQFRLSRFGGPVPFMDEGDDVTDSGGKSNSVSPDGPSSPQEPSTLPGPPPPPPAAEQPGLPRLAAIVDTYISTDQVVQGADGSVIHGHMAVHRQISLEVDGDELPFVERTDKEKEALYQSIADKLREMADSLPISASEGEGHRQGAAFDPNAGQSELSELEKELMMVMRTGGDRLSTAMDDPTDAMTSQVREQVYSKFSSTLRNAIGDEVGWNQLAMFFHITKGAFSAADTTSKVLSRGKEMVMRYFADRFAGWIVKQGGWESMLSESDSELD